MMMIRTLRGSMSLIALAAVIALTAMNLGGCSDEDGSPVTTPQASAPVLPDPSTLNFDFSFFDAGAGMDKTLGDHDHFINAYIRVAVIGAVARLTLTPPLAAFAVALHTTPMPQSDGSWIWTFEWRNGEDRALISLRGRVVGERVEWDMHITIDEGGHSIDDALWFDGSTGADGDEGRWFFRDIEDPDAPICGEIAWGIDERGEYLEFISHEPDSDGDMLRFTDADPDYTIDYVPGQGDEAWFINWHGDGRGSLQVPDYNDGEEACWDTYQRNTICR